MGWWKLGGVMEAWWGDGSLVELMETWWDGGRLVGWWWKKRLEGIEALGGNSRQKKVKKR